MLRSNVVLSELCESASCGEVFLLASAALANITFFDSMACEILLQLNAIQILLQACRDRQRVDTPYSKDQVQDQCSPRSNRKFVSILLCSFWIVLISGRDNLGQPVSLRAVCF